MTNYTPGMAVIRGCYIALMKESGEPGAKARAEFDRWLDTVKAEAWEDGRAAGWAEDCAYDALNPYRQEEK